MKNFLRGFLVFSVASILAVPVSSFAQIGNQNTVAALQAQIATLLAQVRQLQAQLAAVQGQQFCHDWLKNLRVGDGQRIDTDTGPTGLEGDISALFVVLGKHEQLFDFESVAQPGTAGSSFRTSYFSEQLASYVVQFQEKYRSEILTPSGLRNGTGYVGPSTRRKLNALYGCAIVSSGAPVITGIEAPTTLSVGQTGTWTVKAYDPENGTLSYLVGWGDERGVDASGVVILPSPPTFIQASTFTHSYATAGTYTATFLVKDNTGQSANMSVTVRVGSSDQSTITVLSPNGGEIWSIGVEKTIKWKLVKIPAGAYLQLSLTDGPTPIEIKGYASPASGEGSLSYKIPVSGIWLDYSYPLEPGKYKITAVLYDKSPCLAGNHPPTSPCATSPAKILAQDKSNASFTITATQSPVTVTSPNGGEIWTANSVRAITWNYRNATVNDKVDLYLTSAFDCPANAICTPPVTITLDKNINAIGVYNWIVATDIVNNPIPVGRYVMQICVAGTSNCDSSNALFTITSQQLPPCDGYGCAVIENEGKKIVAASPEVKALAAKYGWAHVHISALDIDLIKDIEFIRKLNPNFKEETGCIIVVHAGEEGYVYQEDKDLQIIYKEPIKEFLERTKNVDSATMSKFYLSLH